MNGAVRFLAVKDSQHARKAALLASVLFGLASLIWFLPPMMIASEVPDLGSMYPNLSNPSEAAYLAFVDLYMPAGMLGLMVAAMFAATMSSMDSSLNGGSAMLVKCFYKPILRPDASEKQMLRVGRWFTAAIGIAQISIAVWITGLPGVNLFTLMLSFLGLLGLPIVIPNVLCFFIRKTPDWSAWSTVLVGLCVSGLVAYVFDAAWFAGQTGSELTARELSDLDMVITYAAHLSITTGWFLVSTLFYRPLPAERQAEVDGFYADLATPVTSETEFSDTDLMQRRRLGRMTLAFGVFVMAVALWPRTEGSVVPFLACGGILTLIGALLLAGNRLSLRQPA